MDISVSANVVLTMFFLVTVGFVARKLNIIDESLSKRLSNLILCIAQPFLLISSLVNVEYSKQNLKEGAFIVLLSLVLHIVAAAFGFLCSAPLKDKQEKQIFQYASMFENAAFYGFPVLAAIIGPKGVFWGAFYCISFNILSWTYGLYILGKANPEIKINVKKIFINFGTIPSLIGILIYVLQIPLPKPLLSTMDYLGGLSTPISMLIIGGVLAKLPYKKLFTNIKVYWLCLCKLIIFPAIIGAAVILFKLPEQIALFTLLMAAMPTAATTTVFAEKYDIKPEYAALGVGIATVFSVATIPLVIYVFNLVK